MPKKTALTSEEAPERKKPDDPIIADTVTRGLLLMLLGNWEHFPILEEHYRRIFDDALNTGEAGLRARYGIADYNAGAGEKAAMTWAEIEQARQRRIENAAGRLQAIIGERVRERVIEALDEAGRMAVEAELAAIERRIKTASSNRKAQFTRVIKKVLVPQVTGEDYHFGRPSETKRDEVERRSIEIIRAIGAGRGDKGRVATAYYGDYDLSQPGERDRLERDYKAARRKGSADKLLRRYSKELERQKPAPLTYENLMERASEPTFGLSLAEWLATGTTCEEGDSTTTQKSEAPKKRQPTLG